MRNATRRCAYALLGLALALASSDGRAAPAARAAALPTPGRPASGDTPPPISATATPSPSGQLLKFSGQILDDRAGFVFFTTGDGFRLDPAVRIDDARTGGPTSLRAVTKTYARATFDTGDGRVVELSLSPSKLPDEASYESVKKFAVALSPAYANPDLHTAEGFSGKGVLVAFTVEVPPKTPFGDRIYLATDASGWSATAIPMDRIDALHYRVSRDFGAGARVLYRYTRGSWRSAERGENGLEVKPRLLVVRNSDVQSKTDIVYGWGDADQFSPNLNAVPTPFNPIPFNVPGH